jgi:hypothetical protein
MRGSHSATKRSITDGPLTNGLPNAERLGGHFLWFRVEALQDDPIYFLD